MGCTSSKLDDQEAVKLCRDRKRFMKQAFEQRARFASLHLAYIQSMMRVSAALQDYVQRDDNPQELFSSDSSSTSTKKAASHGFITMLSKSLSPQSQDSQANMTFTVNYQKSGGSTAVSVLERPQQPEIAHVQAYHCGVDGFFAVQSKSPSSVPQSSSQWDFFWDPFSSLELYGYLNQNSLDQIVVDDEIGGSRQVRGEEPVPDLEEGSCVKENVKEEKAKVDSNCTSEVNVEDVDDKQESKDNLDCENGIDHEVAAESQNVEVVEMRSQETAICDGEVKEEKPGFTVYDVKKRPTSIAEVIRDLEAQFKLICNSADKIFPLLEGSKDQHSSNSNEITATKVLNPIALFHSASTRSSSSRFSVSSSISGDEGYESCSDLTEKSFALSPGHQSTLDRLYAWEKKLYEEVRAGEKVRIAYEKKCTQFKNHDFKREDSSVADKTRAAIRDLQTQIKVSLHSVQVVSSRIETLRDEELQPQLLELLQGLAKMWKAMAECHKTQKQTLDEAKLLLADTPSRLDAEKLSSTTNPDPQRLARSAGNLEAELRNWRACFESWIKSQRSYVQALAGWLLRCVQPDPNSSKLPLFSPRRSSGALPIYGMCIQWARSVDAMEEMPVLDGLNSLAAEIGSLHGDMMKLIEVGHVEEAVSEEKTAEVGIEVLCAGMAVAVSSLTEFAAGSAEGYCQLVDQWEKAKWRQSSGGAEM